MERKLKVNPEQAEVTAPVPQEQRPIAGFYVPAQVMDQIFGYIGQGPWLEVNDFINTIRNSVQPVYAKNQPNETQDQPTSAA
jgi:hypothetical protein